MPTLFTYSYKSIDGLNRSGGFIAKDMATARKKVFERAAIDMKMRKSSNFTLKTREEQIKNLIEGGKLNLVNDSTKERMIYNNFATGGGRWNTEAGVNRRSARLTRLHEKRREMPFRIDKKSGLALPGSPLIAHPLINPDGDKPEGSPTGRASFLQIKDGTAIVSDATTTGRFWPATWDGENQVWIVTGDGKQLIAGEVVETFPLKSREQAAGAAIKADSQLEAVKELQRAKGNHPVTGAEILLKASPDSIGDVNLKSFDLPDDRNVKRLPGQSAKLVRVTIEVAVSADRIALTKAHPSIKVLERLEGLLTLKERLEVFRAIKDDVLPFWNTGERRRTLMDADRKDKADAKRKTPMIVIETKEPVRTIENRFVGSSASEEKRGIVQRAFKARFDLDSVSIDSGGQIIGRTTKDNSRTDFGNIKDTEVITKPNGNRIVMLGDKVIRQLSSGLDSEDIKKREEQQRIKDHAERISKTPIVKPLKPRSPRAIAADRAKQAKILIDPNATDPKSLKQLEQWKKHPEQSDVKGVDSFKARPMTQRRLDRG